MKSTVSTQPSAASSVTIASFQAASASSLKPTVGLRAKRSAMPAADGGSPSPSELTKRTGATGRSSAAGSVSPAWRSARSSAADSNAQLRHARAISHSGGATFHWSTVARCSQKLASVHDAGQVEIRAGGVQRLAALSKSPTSSPTPS